MTGKIWIVITTIKGENLDLEKLKELLKQNRWLGYKIKSIFMKNIRKIRENKDNSIQNGQSVKLESKFQNKLKGNN